MFFFYLYCLQLADGGPERVAFVCVVRSAVQRRLRDTESLGRDADPSAVQGLLSEAEKRFKRTQRNSPIFFFFKSTSSSEPLMCLICVCVSCVNTMAILNPAPRGPSILLSGILQSSRIMLAVDEALIPSLSSFFPRESPGCGMGIRKALMPYRHRGGGVGNKTAATSRRRIDPCFDLRGARPRPGSSDVPCASASCLWWRTRQWRTRPRSW